MAVIRSLKRTPALLLEHPIVFVPMLLFGLVQFAAQIPQTYAQSIDPLVAMVVSLAISGLYLFVVPFFQGGLLGVANDAATSEVPSLRGFLEHGKEHYLSLLGAYLLFFAIAIVLWFALFIGLFVGLFGFVASDGSLAVLAALALVGLAVFVLYVVVVTAVHFYGHAIVIENVRALEGFKRSVAVVRANLVSVVGYVALAIAGGIVVGGAFVAIVMVAFPTMVTDPTTTPALGSLVLGYGFSTLLTTILGAFYLVFSVVFYRSVAGIDGADGTSAPLAR